MDKLSKTQKDEYATAFAMLALYDGKVSGYPSSFTAMLLHCLQARLAAETCGWKPFYAQPFRSLRDLQPMIFPTLITHRSYYSLNSRHRPKLTLTKSMLF